MRRTAPQFRRRPRAALVRRGVLGVVAGYISLLSGCAIYHAKPLPTGPDLSRAPVLTVPVGAITVPGVKPEPFDLAKGLTETNVVTLAVVSNPKLKAIRLQAGVARAQLLEAGLLPDPQISGGLSKSSLFTGYSATLAEDIQALITRGAAQDAAKAHLNQVNLDILWQEWQVAERARELYIETQALAKLRGVLNERRQLLERLCHEDEVSLRRSDVTVSDVTADFMAWKSAETAWRTFKLKDNQTRHALNELLGLAPGVQLRLQDTASAQSITPAQYQAALAALPRRRPDLLALQAGYHSAEERLREAILAQFPLVNAGVTKARSAEEGIQSIGFQVTLTLPLFNRNRGPIAVGHASRAHLYQAYQARLDETTSEADQVWTAVGIMRHQLKTLDARLSGFEHAAAAAKESLTHGTLSLADYASVDSNALATRAEEIQLRASLEQAQAALATLLALPI
ncbi:MAG: TolC family protein [Betaproteobacteria bacterium]|nr:TolC family protein [Betaproteobacteria bacterium]